MGPAHKILVLFASVVNEGPEEPIKVNAQTFQILPNSQTHEKLDQNLGFYPKWICHHGCLKEVFCIYVCSGPYNDLSHDM